MNPIRWRTMLGLATVLALGTVLQAQPIGPRIGYVYPAGGQQGATFQVVVAGQYLSGASKAFVSGTGVQATVLEHIEPLTVEQGLLLKDKLTALQEKKAAARQNGTPWAAADEKMLTEIREKFSTFIPKNQVNPAIVENVIVQITVAPDAEPGERDLRLETPLGLSNPRVFCVGSLPEFSRKPSKTYRPPKDGMGPKIPTPEGEMTIALPATVNGQIMPGATNRFRFKAVKGQKLVIVSSARQLIPYLPDAVPGWFQATLTLFNDQGSEVAFADHFLFHTDPVLYYAVPADGEYVAEMRDSIYRGREDFVYRLTIGEVPYITSIFPLGGRAGTQANVELQGWNLPVAGVPVKITDKGVHIRTIGANKGEMVSNRMPFATDTLPECIKKGPINSPATAMAVTLPIIINGRIETPGECDVFRLESKAGQHLVAEVFARRLDSPLDSVLQLTDANGLQLAFNDDFEDKGSGLNTHHADSYISTTLPADRTYYVHLGDTQNKGGAEYGYRLRLSSPQPDFELRVVPSSINVCGGESVAITVYAVRRDGFAGEIALSLPDAPSGFTLAGARVPENQDKVRLTLAAPAAALKEPLTLKLEGRAMIRGQSVSRLAVPAEDQMQAFAFRHLVPAHELKVDVIVRNMGRFAAKLQGESPVKLPMGGTVRVRFETSAAFAEGVGLELIEPPDGVAIQEVLPVRNGTEIVLRCDAAKVKPGLQGNLIIGVFAEKAAVSEKAKARGNTQRRPIGSLPAIPFIIVPKST